jgi:hypothetical protein
VNKAGMNEAAAIILRALYRIGEHPPGKYYAAPNRMTVENVEALIAWLQADEAQAKSKQKLLQISKRGVHAEWQPKPSVAWLDALVDSYRRGAHLFGSTENDEWVVDITEAAPVLIALARKTLGET